MKITAETLTKFKWSVRALKETRQIVATLVEDIYFETNGVMRGKQSDVWSAGIDLRDAIDGLIDEMKRGEHP